MARVVSDNKSELSVCLKKKRRVMYRYLLYCIGNCFIDKDFDV